ncbi:hypothetical protein [Ulvibacter sp. MAR_2010_11]|uniref:hypothetical protein n=1 Tax=Ulvibacter sp. MAR_2010_11 TaxID=1250229 RepID=UPI000C2CC796|nr:hypothetical protein [Ulvibacter sp. MAR_2010_11]
MALVINKRETIVKHGENGGRTLVNSNIVIEEIQMSLNKKTGEALLLIPDIVSNEDSLSLIAYIQSKNLTITGAGSAKL